MCHPSTYTGRRNFLHPPTFGTWVQRRPLSCLHVVSVWWRSVHEVVASFCIRPCATGRRSLIHNRAHTSVCFLSVWLSLAAYLCVSVRLLLFACVRPIFTTCFPGSMYRRQCVSQQPCNHSHKRANVNAQLR